MTRGSISNRGVGSRRQSVAGRKNSFGGRSGLNSRRPAEVFYRLLTTAYSLLMNQERVAGLLDGGRAVRELAALGVDLDDRGVAERALDERLGERVFDVLLERAPERPRAVGAVAAGLLDDPALGLLRQADFEAATGERLVQLLDLEADDLQQLVVGELVEDDDLVE